MNTLEVLYLRSYPGSYSAKYEEYSRPGDDGHRFHYIGTKGDKGIVQAVLKADKKQDAWELINDIESLIGYEIQLQDILNDEEWQVYLSNSTTVRVYRIGGRPSSARDNWRIEIDLELTRTA